MDNPEKNIQLVELDIEWVELIKEAKQIGLSLDEILLFLQNGHAAK